jgi:hypothetical protein
MVANNSTVTKCYFFALAKGCDAFFDRIATVRTVFSKYRRVAVFTDCSVVVEQRKRVHYRHAFLLTLSWLKLFWKAVDISIHSWQSFI